MTAFSPRRAQVLVVDDSPGVLLAMKELLSPFLPVQVADGASTALQVLSPDTALVLADVRMPGMDGLELARTIKTSHPDLPVVLMTGIVEDGLRTQAQAIGVLDVLRKPLRAETLLPALQEWLPAQFPAAAPEGVQQEAGSPAIRETASDTSATPGEPQPTSLSAPAPRHPLAPLLTGLGYLPGILMTAVYDSSGDLIESHPASSAQIGAYARYLSASTATLATHIHAEGQVRAVQVEFCDRVLVINPASSGYLVALVRDTSAASSVKAWLRTHLHDAQQAQLN